MAIIRKVLGKSPRWGKGCFYSKASVFKYNFLYISIKRMEDYLKFYILTKKRYGLL